MTQIEENKIEKFFMKMVRIKFELAATIYSDNKRCSRHKTDMKLNSHYS